MKIVFVCTGNTCRSAMAEYLLRRALAEDNVPHVSVRSAGLYAHPSQPASRYAFSEMEKRNVSLAGHAAARATREALKGALVLCMTGAQAAQVRLMAPEGARVETLNEFSGLPGEIEDPCGRGEAAYACAAREIERAVTAAAKRIAEENS